MGGLASATCLTPQRPSSASMSVRWSGRLSRASAYLDHGEALRAAGVYRIFLEASRCKSPRRRDVILRFMILATGAVRARWGTHASADSRREGCRHGEGRFMSMGRLGLGAMARSRLTLRRTPV